MTKKERDGYLAGIKKYIEESKNETPEEARRFLQRAGILDKFGELAEPYKTKVEWIEK